MRPSIVTQPRRSPWIRVAFTVLTVAAIWLAGRAIYSQWRLFLAAGEKLILNWGWILASALLVLLSYAVLIEVWRRTVAAWEGREKNELRWGDAARIWLISNLGRYLPGKIWQLGAMSTLARQRGVSAMAAAGSALVINLLNLLAGLGVLAITGAEHLESRGAALALGGLLALSVLATPWVLPRLGAIGSRLLGRQLAAVALPHHVLWLATLGCALAWLLYGVAFDLFVRGVIGSAPGSTASYIAAFTGSYLVGYIAVFTPGGIGVREASLVASLGVLGLPPGAPGIVALTSRLWLMALELVPGVVLLALEMIRSRQRSIPKHGIEG